MFSFVVASFGGFGCAGSFTPHTCLSTYLTCPYLPCYLLPVSFHGSERRGRRGGEEGLLVCSLSHHTHSTLHLLCTTHMPLLWVLVLRRFTAHCVHTPATHYLPFLQTATFALDLVPSQRVGRLAVGCYHAFPHYVRFETRFLVRRTA